MKPATFPQANCRLGAPPGMDNCDEITVYAGANQVISCWQPTEEERAAIAAGAPVWLHFATTAGTLPPVALSTDDPFRAEEATHTGPKCLDCGACLDCAPLDELCRETGHRHRLDRSLAGVRTAL